MEICICDDEKVIQNKLERILSKVLDEHSITYKISKFSTGNELLSYLENNDVDIVLLDIEMPENDGFQVAQRINERNENRPILLFVTNRDDLVFDSFSYKPFRFIRKSHLEELKSNILLAYEESQKDNHDIIVKTDTKVVKVPAKKIVHIERQGRMVGLTTETETYFIYETIGNMAKAVQGERFIKINEGCLVNFRYVDCIKDYDIYLKNGDALPISRRKKKDILEQIKLYMR